MHSRAQRGPASLCAAERLADQNRLAGNRRALCPPARSHSFIHTVKRSRASRGGEIEVVSEQEGLRVKQGGESLSLLGWSPLPAQRFLQGGSPRRRRNGWPPAPAHADADADADGSLLVPRPTLRLLSLSSLSWNSRCCHVSRALFFLTSCIGLRVWTPTMHGAPSPDTGRLGCFQSLVITNNAGTIFLSLCTGRVLCS